MEQEGLNLTAIDDAITFIEQMPEYLGQVPITTPEQARKLLDDLNTSKRVIAELAALKKDAKKAFDINEK